VWLSREPPLLEPEAEGGSRLLLDGRSSIHDEGRSLQRNVRAEAPESTGAMF
jgi:hypothetical protein